MTVTIEELWSGAISWSQAHALEKFGAKFIEMRDEYDGDEIDEIIHEIMQMQINCDDFKVEGHGDFTLIVFHRGLYSQSLVLDRNSYRTIKIS